MTSLARAFLAVVPPAEVRDALAARLAPLHGLPGAARLRWTRPDQWHLTLRFCGAVPDVDALVGAVGGALEGGAAVAGLQVAGAGAFPEARHGTVLWAGCAEGAPAAALGRVAAAVEAGCVVAGFAPEQRPFRPHVTVARAPRARDLRPLVDRFGPGPVGSPWTADAVLLMATDTRPEGSVYEEVARFPLGG